MRNVLDCFFPGYLFVALDLKREHWRSINGTRGVIRLVGCGGSEEATPTPVPTGIVERLKELSAPNGELRFDEVLSAGDRVRILGGPFDALCGVLQEAGDKERVTILLDILSKQTRVEIERRRLISA